MGDVVPSRRDLGLILWFLLNISLSETEVYYSTYSYKTFLPITSQHLKFWAGFWPVALMSILPYIAGVTIRRFTRLRWPKRCKIEMRAEKRREITNQKAKTR